GDLDGDGDPDLVLALEWGPVKILRNHNGKFTDATKACGLDALKGWWNSVTLGDFDADGRLDIAAGNWGRNSKYEESYSRANPLRIAYGDFDNNGVVDIVENHYDKETGTWVPERGRSCSMNAMPFIGERNKTFDQFGSGSLAKIYGDCLKDGTVLEANTLTHTLFLNRGNTFASHPLPAEAQFAPVFGMNVADFDGDGHEDLFVAQNFFASQRETPRSDGGRGLLLRGDGKGSFTSVPGQESGLKIYGEQRGSAVADYNRDGRPDLVVTQNGASTHLYQNVLGSPGLRVRLNAGPANPTGVGAIARLIFAEKKGPAKIVTAGSGYWSQDSATLIFARPTVPIKIEVQWPHGQTITTAIPTSEDEIEVTPQGTLIMPGN
ncbi:MAG: VCBS repeat-containing protein, partial [Verrucomicrobiales bacterium]|nr:VCBS repeat-containing protein [Verrucomicrobiales bacterium]